MLVLNSSVDNVCDRKRKRTKNTSREQLEIYLEAMENDHVLRSNTINPTLDPTYLQDKWDQLALQLNSVGDGPILNAEEWKKVIVHINEVQGIYIFLFEFRGSLIGSMP